MPVVRTALPFEAQALSALALRSKAHWGYDAAFLEAAHSDLAITAEQLGAWIVAALEESDAVYGFYALRPLDAHVLDLERLFVDPHMLGRGYGRQLFEHAVDGARGRGFRRIDIASDPYAEEFYLRVGATRVGDVASVIAGRRLPLLRFDLF